MSALQWVWGWHLFTQHVPLFNCHRHIFCYPKVNIPRLLPFSKWCSHCVPGHGTFLNSSWLRNAYELQPGHGPIRPPAVVAHAEVCCCMKRSKQGKPRQLSQTWLRGSSTGVTSESSRFKKVQVQVPGQTWNVWGQSQSLTLRYLHRLCEDRRR